MKALVLTFQKDEENQFEEILSMLTERAECVCVDTASKAVRIFPGLEIRLKEQTVYRNDMPVPLSHYEFFVLWFPTEHPGWVFTRRQIYEAVWKNLDDDSGAAVSSVISQLRRKLWPENPKGSYIRTVHNSGYKFDPS